MFNFSKKSCFCLIILVLHWKILVSDFWQRLVLYQKPCLLLKKRKPQGAPTKVGFTIFPWHFVHVLYVAMPKNLCMDLFVLLLFWFLRIYQFKKITSFLALSCRHSEGEHMYKIWKKGNTLCWVGTSWVGNIDCFKQKTSFR